LQLLESTPISPVCITVVSIKKQTVQKLETYLNSLASSPQMDFALFMARIGINIVWPFFTLSRQEFEVHKPLKEMPG
jgi:hypothetical protein